VRILVTGASGLLGLNLALTAATETAEKHIVFGQVFTHPIRSPGFTVWQADLLAPGAVESMLDQAQPDWVINCAALAVVDACEADPALAQQLNVDLPAKLATLVGRGGARLVHLSTDAVFDGRSGGYSEADLPNPLSVYARTKLAGERAVAEAHPGALIARVNLYGWSLSGQRSLAEFFFYNLQAGRGVNGFTDVHFCPLLVNDLSQLLLKMLGKGLHGLYHAVSSECLTKYDFAIALARRFGFDEALVRPTRVGEAGLNAVRSPNLTLRCDRLVNALGEPIPGFSQGLERFYTLYQQGYPQMLKDLAFGG
jgi:dTDP-4-dehydrorhamnose reductase